MAEQDIDVEALDRFLSDHNSHRVGRYFESLLHFWFAQIRHLEVIGAGVQVRDDKRTIGEIDFLYRDESGVLVHCEVAVKYFLHYVRSGQSHYPGPNASDNFELKTEKLFGQQLGLSHQHFPDVGRRDALVKGMAFYHQALTQRVTGPDIYPARMAPNHLRGTWLRASELDELGDRSDLVGAVADKPRWLAADVDAEPLVMSELLDQLHRQFRDPIANPRMVSLRAADTGSEVERLFIVPEVWPERPV